MYGSHSKGFFFLLRVLHALDLGKNAGISKEWVKLELDEGSVLHVTASHSEQKIPSQETEAGVTEDGKATMQLSVEDGEAKGGNDAPNDGEAPNAADQEAAKHIDAPFFKVRPVAAVDAFIVRVAYEWKCLCCTSMSQHTSRTPMF